MPYRIIAYITLFLTLAMPLRIHAEVVKIGVLSEQGFHSSMKQWQDTANYLTAKIPGHVFQVLPYSRYSDLKTDVNKNKLDFLLAAKHELPRFVTEFSVIPLMIAQAGKSGPEWSLTRKKQLPYQLTYSVSEALLKLPAKHNAMKRPGLSTWQLSEEAHVAISSEQKLKKLFHTSTELALGVVKQYGAYLLALLVSSLLIYLYRKWDQYHTRQAKIKEHRQQANDPSLSDTVF